MRFEDQLPGREDQIRRTVMNGIPQCRGLGRRDDGNGRKIQELGACGAEVVPPKEVEV